VTKADFKEALDSAGEIAFPQQASASDRTIESAWLSERLTSSSAGVQITNGIFTGRLGLQSVTVKGPLALVSCTLDEVIFEYCTFEEWIVFDTCTVGTLQFRGSKFQRALFAPGSIVEGLLDLGDVSVDANVNLAGCVVRGKVYANGLTAASNVLARDARFESSFDFSLANLKGQLELNRAVMLGKVTIMDSTFGALSSQNVEYKGEVAFDRSTVRSAAFFQESVFHEYASFNGFATDGQFILHRCDFKRRVGLEGLRSNDLYASEAKFGGNTSLIGSELFSCNFASTVFSGDLAMQDTKLVGGASFGGATFAGLCRFDRMNVGSGMRFARYNEIDVEFKSHVSFSGTRIGSQLVFESVTFGGALACESMTVDADVSIDHCEVVGPFSFVGSCVTSNLDVGGTKFLGKVDVTNARVGGHLLMWDAEFTETPTLINTTVGSSLNLKRSQLHKGLVLDYARVSGRTIFSESSVTGTLSARMAVLRTLVFDEQTEPGDERSQNWAFSKVQFAFGGLEYDRIDVQWRPFMNALGNSPEGRDRQPYFRLEAALRAIGQDRWADDVYYFARSQIAKSYQPIARVGDFVARAISGYGVRPILLVIWISALLVASVVFFMVPGAARPTSVAASHYRCDRSPAVFQATGLAFRALAPGGEKVVDGWTISDCALTPLHIKPFTVVGFFQIAGAILIPFLLSQVSALWRYGRGRS